MGTPAAGGSARLRSEMTSRRQGFGAAPALQRTRVAGGQGDVEVGVGGGQRLPLLGGQRLDRWSVEPSGEEAGVAALGGHGTGDDGHVHGDAAFAQVGPESAMLADPATQFAVGLAAGIGVDEASGSIVGGDRQSEGEVAPRALVRGAVEAARKPGEAEAAAPEVEHLLRLGGEPREGGLSKHVLEREKTAEEDDLLRRPAVADVLEAEGAVEAAAMDAGVAETRRVSRKGMLVCEAASDETMDEAMGGPRGAAVMLSELPAGEDAGMEADEGEPGGVGGRETEVAERLLTASKMGNLEGLFHGWKLAGRSAWRLVTRTPRLIHPKSLAGTTSRGYRREAIRSRESPTRAGPRRHEVLSEYERGRSDHSHGRWSRYRGSASILRWLGAVPESEALFRAVGPAGPSSDGGRRRLPTTRGLYPCLDSP